MVDRVKEDFAVELRQVKAKIGQLSAELADLNRKRHRLEDAVRLLKPV
jgi:hypothetical protein